MAVPKKRHSKSKVGRRRLHIFLKEPNLVKCQKCGNFILPHRVCPSCGYYRGKEVINVLAKLEKEEKKKEKKRKRKEEKTSESERTL